MVHRRWVLFAILLMVDLVACRYVSATATKIHNKRNLPCPYNNQNCGGGGGCDGTSCNNNNCNNNDDSCCGEKTTSNCVTTCTQQCTTPRCRSYCAQACDTRCQQQNSCPVTQDCVNNCANRCSTTGTGSRCVNSCTNSCNDCNNKATPSVIQMPPIPRPEIIVVTNNQSLPPSPPPPPPPIQSPSNINNTNFNAVNLTTHINLNNVIHNINNISIPVYINYTNTNNIHVNNTLPPPSSNERVVIVNSDKQQRSSGCLNQPKDVECIDSEPALAETIINNNCCFIYHPRTCFADNSTGTPTEKCVIRRHRECSNRCISSNIYQMPLVQPTAPMYIPMMSQPPQQTPCQFIQQYPYFHCGGNNNINYNYQQQRADCSQCYQCNGSYNPDYCSRTEQCSANCRSTMINCIPNNLGVYCQ